MIYMQHIYNTLIISRSSDELLWIYPLSGYIYCKESYEHFWPEVPLFGGLNAFGNPIFFAIKIYFIFEFDEG